MNRPIVIIPVILAFVAVTAAVFIKIEDDDVLERLLPGGSTGGFNAECSAWNQDKFDEAKHAISQKREVSLKAQFLNDGTPLKNGQVVIKTPREEKIFWENMFEADGIIRSEQKTDARGMLETTVPYNVSRLHFALEEYGLTLRWFRPQKNFKELAFTFDANTAVIDKDAPLKLEDGVFAIPFSYNHDFILKEIDISYGRLLGISLVPGEDTYATEQGLAKLEILDAAADGKETTTGTVYLDMKQFLAEWADNYSYDITAQDYEISMEFDFIPPENFFKETASTKKDSPFEPKKYACERNSSDGNPYIDIPSTQDETLLKLERIFQIQLPQAASADN